MADDDKVLVPSLGYQPRDRVFKIEPDQVIDLSEGRVRVRDKSGRVVREVERRERGTEKIADGWNASTWWLNNTAEFMTLMRATWPVPPAPLTYRGQTVFLFPSWAPLDAADAILQPVLQYGPSAAGGAGYWAISSWYIVIGTATFYSPLTRVSSGQSLTGVMTKTGGASNYNCKFNGFASSSLTIASSEELIWANNALESYGIINRNDYPFVHFTQFTSVDIEVTGAINPELEWTVINNITDLGQHAEVINPANPGGVHRLYYDMLPSPSRSLSPSSSPSASPSPVVPSEDWVTIYEEAFPVLKTNSGMVTPVHKDATPHGATARDSDYPALGKSESIKIVSVGGRNVLSSHYGGSQDYSVSAWAADRIGAVAGSGLYPNYLNCNRRVRFIADYQLNNTAWDQNTWAPALSINTGVGWDGNCSIELSKSGTDNSVLFRLWRWDSSNVLLSSYSMAKATWVGRRIRFQIDYTPGTRSGSDVALDGEASLVLIDLDTLAETSIYAVSGMDLWLSYAGQGLDGSGSVVPADNHITGFSLGFYGLPGDCERFLIQAWEEVVTPPTGSPSEPPPPPASLPPPVIVASEDSDCAATSDVNKENSPGPIEPVVDPSWYPQCSGQGTVEIVADLIDPESWIS